MMASCESLVPKKKVRFYGALLCLAGIDDRLWMISTFSFFSNAHCS